MASQPSSPLDLDGLPLEIVQRGLQGLPLDEQLTSYCARIYGAGFPMQRVQIGMDTLHPRYGSHTFVWQPGSRAMIRSHERSMISQEMYLRSPVYFMRTRGLSQLRRRLDQDDLEDFLLFPELRAEGYTEYAACLVPYDPAQLEAIARKTDSAGEAADSGRAVDGIFFSCATRCSGGFDHGQLDQVTATLPYLAISLKSRLTYDVASTVLGTYLGGDAGHRVLNGTIERGSGQAIRAVIWFSDLRGFTKLTDTLPRDDLIAVLNDYLEAMARPVQDKNGQILKFMGDGLLAVFDLTGRDEAAVCRDALEAAAQLRREFPTFNAQRRKAGKPTMDFGLALHLGEVLYGNIGASERLDFTVVGPAVNEASRIQALCRPLDRNVLVSSAFREAAGDKGTRLEPLGSHQLRGVASARELFTPSG